MSFAKIKNDFLKEISSSFPPKGYILSVPLWGDEYVRLFLSLSLPSLLSPRNLPFLQGKYDCLLQIYTKSQWVGVLENALIIKTLRKIIPVSLLLLENDLSNPYHGMSEGHRRGLSEAKLRGSAAIFLIPDHIFADGFIEGIVHKAENGYRIVTISGLRANRENVETEINSKYRVGETIVVQPRELMKIAIDNLHDINRQSFLNYQGTDFVPSNFFWKVGEGGEILAHCFHQAPMMVYPERKSRDFHGTIDADLVQSVFRNSASEYVVVDSDEIAMLELSPINRVMQTGLRARTEEIFGWTTMNTSLYNWKLVSYPIRLHYGLSSEGEWETTEKQANQFICDLRSLWTQEKHRVNFGRLRAFLKRTYNRFADKFLLIRKIVRFLKRTRGRFSRAS